MIAPVSSNAFQRYQTPNQSPSYRNFGVLKTTHAGGVGRGTGGNLKYGGKEKEGVRKEEGETREGREEVTREGGRERGRKGRVGKRK